MEKILIKNGKVKLQKGFEVTDVLIEDGVISRIAPGIVAQLSGEVPCGDSTPCGCKVIDASGCVVLPGLADVHVHFREPGYSYKETIKTGSAAAAAGGFTAVCPMPNLNPAPDSPETIEQELEFIRRDACIEVKPFATITKGRKGLEVVDVEALKPLCVGFSDDGSGVQRDDIMREAMTKMAKYGCVLSAHCEDNSLLKGGYIHDGKYCAEHGHKGICSESEWGQIARDLKLVEETGCAYHVCHISTKESVELIRQAKARGVNVTCETGPHYLTLCEDNLQEDGRFKMNPPLRGADDKAALVAGLVDGTIDCIATDHAPHSAEEKSRGLEKSAMGVTGLECSFPVVYTHLVMPGIISLDTLVDRMCTAPRRRFNLGGGEIKEGVLADLTVFDVTTPYTIDPDKFVSLGHSTPFAGMRVYGKCKTTIYKGEVVYEATR